MKIFTNFKLLLFLILFQSVSLMVKSQDLNISGNKDNKPKLCSDDGNVFYLTFHPCYMSATDNANSVSIYVVSPADGKVTLEIPALKIIRTQNLMQNRITEFKLTPIEAFTYLREPNDSVFPERIFTGRALQIHSEISNITCYGVVKFNGRTEGYQVMASSSYGKDYQVATSYSLDQPVYTSIIGVYENTKVTFRLGGCESSEIVRDNGDTIHFGGVIRRTLNVGDVWVIPGFGNCNDLTGSVITSTKPVAVITGNYSSAIPYTLAANNYLIEQEMPTNLWGTNYFVSPIMNRKYFSIIKIFAKKPYTQVYLDGVPMWTINTPGGTSGIGFIEARAGVESIRPVVISSDEGYPINVIQFNPSDDDVAKINIPFKMQLIPVEQFTKNIVFATPAIAGDSAYVDNFINIVYKAKSDGSIPDDMQFAEVVNGKFNWMPMNVYDNNPGTPFFEDKHDVNGRKYYSKILRLKANGVYKLKANDAFTVNIYGDGKNGAYGFPAINSSYDLETPDTLAPYIEFNRCCCYGDIYGSVKDEPRIDPENRSNLGLIYMDITDSYNYNFTFEPYVVGDDASTNFQMYVIDVTQNAQAHLVFVDRAGNRFDSIIKYISVIPKILESKADFGTYNNIEPPIIKTMTFTLKNVGGNEISADKFRIYLTLRSKHLNISSYQKFDLVDVEGANLAPLNNGEEIKFKIKFTGDKYGYFKDSIGVAIVHVQGEGDTCAISYFTEISALIVQAFIITDDYDFQKQEIYKSSEPETLKITNPKTTEYNSLADIRITGYLREGDYTDSLGSGAIFEVDGLQGITESNPLIIKPGENYPFKVSFSPDSKQSYESKITFITKTENSMDYLNTPDNVCILKGVGELPASVNNTDTKHSIISISPNPARDYIEISSFHPTLKRRVDECSEIQIIDMLGTVVASIHPMSDLNRMNIEYLLPGIYFIKLGNRVEKFVKI